MRSLVAAHKIFWFGLLCLVTFPLLFIWRILFSRTPIFHWAQCFYHLSTCKIFGIKVRKIGDIPNGHVIFLGNHLSYIDIPVLGGILKATFISKDDVKKWPIFGQLALLAETVFISRDRNAVEKCITDIKAMLARKRSLILFPEGTSSSGEEILPFKTSLFEIFLNDNLKQNIVIQPFTIVIQKADQKIVANQNDRDFYAWYGDMEMLPHLWALAKTKGIEIDIVFHKQHHASNFDNRKDFANICHQDVVQGLEKHRTG